MITADSTFQTSTSIGVTEILTQFNGLIYRAVTITEVGGLRVTKVDSKAFRGAYMTDEFQKM